ncbi:retrovirus-related pol polyprotein from transposon TNT 1-94 [Tanacetum coccineum]
MEGVVGLRRWIEKVEQVFETCKCAEEDKVMFAASTFEGRALTWWNGNVHTLGLVNANHIPWTEFKTMMTTEYCPATEIQRMEQELWTLTLKGDDIEAYNNRFHELALMCPELVPTEKKKIERYTRGFPERIKGNITSSKPATLHDAINMARELVEQAVQGKATRIGESNKRKWEDHQRNTNNNNNNPNNNNNRNRNNNYHQQQNRRQETARAYAAAPTKNRGYAGNLPKCNRCNFHHSGRCPPKCQMPRYWSSVRRIVRSYTSRLLVILTTSVSRPQLKSNRFEDRVMHNNSEGKKQQVEDHRRTKMPMAVPISTREPKRIVNQSVATPLKRTVAPESTKQKPRSTVRKLYEHVSKTCSWWYPKFTPLGYKWKPKLSTMNVKPNISMPLGNKSRTTNISESITLKGSTLSNTPLSSNSFAARRDNSIHHRLWVLKAHDGKSQAFKLFCGAISGVYYVEGLNHNLFSVSQFCDADLEVAFQKSACYIRDLKGNDLLIATSSQAWLWHRRLSYLNFDTINLLSKYDIVTSLPKLKFVKDHLCSSYELGKAKRKSKDETPEVLIEFLKLVQRGLHAQVRTVETDKAISTSCLTQNRSLVIPRHEKTPCHIINGQKPSVKFFYIFGSLCYIVRDGENLDKMKEKDHVSSDLVPQSETVTTSNEMDLLFSPMFDELLNGTTSVVSKSSAVTATDAPNQRQHHNTTSSTSTIVAADIPPLNIQTTHETTI